MSAGGEGSDPELKYTCHTTKKLMMQRIFLTEKKEGETSTGQPEQSLLFLLMQLIELLWPFYDYCDTKIYTVLHATPANVFFFCVCVAPAGSDDTGEQNDATCQSNQEENADQQVESEEDMDNTDLDDSAVSWYMKAFLCFELAFVMLWETPCVKHFQKHSGNLTFETHE